MMDQRILSFEYYDFSLIYYYFVNIRFPFYFSLNLWIILYNCYFFS